RPGGGRGARSRDGLGQGRRRDRGGCQDQGSREPSSHANLSLSGPTAQSSQPPSSATVSTRMHSSSRVSPAKPSTRQSSARNPASPTTGTMSSTTSWRKPAWHSSGRNQTARTASPTQGGASEPTSRTTPTPAAAYVSRRAKPPSSGA